jgi:hypothetical protein
MERRRRSRDRDRPARPEDGLVELSVRTRGDFDDQVYAVRSDVADPRGGV